MSGEPLRVKVPEGMCPEASCRASCKCRCPAIPLPAKQLLQSDHLVLKCSNGYNRAAWTRRWKRCGPPPARSPVRLVRRRPPLRRRRFAVLVGGAMRGLVGRHVIHSLA